MRLVERGPVAPSAEAAMAKSLGLTKTAQSQARSYWSLAKRAHRQAVQTMGLYFVHMEVRPLEAAVGRALMGEWREAEAGP